MLRPIRPTYCSQCTDPESCEHVEPGTVLLQPTFLASGDVRECRVIILQYAGLYNSTLRLRTLFAAATPEAFIQFYLMTFDNVAPHKRLEAFDRTHRTLQLDSSIARRACRMLVHCLRVFMHLTFSTCATPAELKAAQWFCCTYLPCTNTNLFDFAYYRCNMTTAMLRLMLVHFDFTERGFGKNPMRACIAGMSHRRVADAMQRVRHLPYDSRGEALSHNLGGGGLLQLQALYDGRVAIGDVTGNSWRAECLSIRVASYMWNDDTEQRLHQFVRDYIDNNFAQHAEPREVVTDRMISEMAERYGEFSPYISVNFASLRAANAEPWRH